MDEAISELLNVLELAEAAGAPLNDTVIRESLWDAIYQGFIVQEPGYRVPDDILLNYTEPAARQNAAVVSALARFLERARKEAAATGLDTQDDRDDAFLNSEATSLSGEVSVGSFFD